MKVDIGPYNKTKKDKIKIESHDIISLDYTLAKVILPALKAYKKTALKRVTWGSCCDDYEVYNKMSKQEKDASDYRATRKMEDILDKMILAFQHIATGAADEHTDDVQIGLELFGKYYRALWW